ncbi:type IV secretory system conjugative DNA transfer family protein [Vagococcus fluvialis]|uniref:type IV secretory system conjugative DNA transfer family protein n=1 Tax=Vagococcus fluvialis TaxID=2738 RepID=UPI003B21E9C4
MLRENQLHDRAEPKDIRSIIKLFESHKKFRFSKSKVKRKETQLAKEILLSPQSLSLKTSEADSFIRTCLATLANCKSNAVIQLIIDSSIAPRPLPKELINPHTKWWQAISGHLSPISNETKKQLINKQSLPQFNCSLRFGISSQNKQELHSLINCLKLLESSEVKIRTKEISPTKIDEVSIPWQFPLKLSTLELAFLGLLPAGNEDFDGLAKLHPKVILPPLGLKQNHKRFFGETTTLEDLTESKMLGISGTDSLFHTVLLGGTGSGKSTSMLHLALSDIESGNSTLIIDPKGDLVRDILERFPDSRKEDLIIIDPTADRIVSVNPFDLLKYGVSPELLTQYLLSIFQDLFADNWGIRSADVLSHSLLTLAEFKNSTLLMLPELLTNNEFRKRILSEIDDPLGIEPFWHYYNNLSQGEQIQLISPVLNKLRQLFIHPSLKCLFGQSESNYSLTDLFFKRKVILVSLNKGVIGAESAKFLGSILVSLTWSLALSRASIPSEKRHRVSLFIDELQDYLKLPISLSDALIQAKGLGVSLTLAHQYRHQLPQDIKMAIDANCKNKICFGLDMNDANDMAKQSPELTAEDFYYLPQYHIYTKLHNGGHSTGWLLAKTFPLPARTRSYDHLVAQNMMKYGRPISEIEADFIEKVHGNSMKPSKDKSKNISQRIGRRKKE